MTNQPRIYLSPPHMGSFERNLLLEAFDSNWVAPLGPHVNSFEAEMCDYLNVPSAAALSSGTAALHLALMILGVGAEDTVLVSSLTFSATANAVRYCGATPVFIDSHPETWTMDVSLLEEEIAEAVRRGRCPKAVIPVDIYGQCADYDAIQGICQKYHIPIIEDAAEALGSTYRDKAAGSFGDFGILSFNGNKIITTSGGGMLTSHNPDWIERAKYLATQARDPAPHYQHSTIGYNYRLSNLLAAVGRGQLRHIDERVARRREINCLYREALETKPGIQFMPVATYGTSNCWLTCIRVDSERFGMSAEEIRLKLDQNNIEARPIWKPMHLQPVFSECRIRGGKVSEAIFADGLCLPSGSSLTDQDLDRIVGIILG